MMNAARFSALFAAAGLIAFSPRLTTAEPARIKPLLNFRWRYEDLETLSGSSTRDSQYGFSNLRLRFGLDLAAKNFSIHVLAQAAGAYSLPANGSFGIGRTTFEESGGADRSPGQIGLAEFSVRFQPTRSVTVTAGRIGLMDGLETRSGDPRFDWIKTTRLSERLVGTWDWVNVGRRYDGLVVQSDTPTWNLSASGARVLQGGIDYDDAFDHLDGVDVGSLVFTSKRGARISSSEVRVFNLIYRDARPSTEAGLGDRLLIDTLGASLVGVYPWSAGAFDLMLWAAYQFGDYGAQSQHAAAFVAEAGYGWPKARGSPWLRGGVARSSGDGDPNDGDHHTFFNLVPTNHKYYGSQDFSAFQNLTNLYSQLQLRPHPRFGLLLEAHLFRLSESADAWYGGSGPANNASFGYVARRAPNGLALDRDIGSEFDLSLDWDLTTRVGLQLGASRFNGGAAARTLFTLRSDSNWLYLQTVLTY